MSAITYIIDTLLSVALFFFLARLLLQLTRADFRNPISQAVVRITNPLILPLRRVLPPIGKVDTASVLAVLLVATAASAVRFALLDSFPGTLAWVRAVLVDIASMLLWTYFYAVVLYTLLTLIAPGGYSPVQSVLTSLCEPVLRPVRRISPPVGGLDLSPLWVIIAIQALLILLR